MLPSSDLTVAIALPLSIPKFNLIAGKLLPPVFTAVAENNTALVDRVKRSYEPCILLS